MNRVFTVFWVWFVTFTVGVALVAALMHLVDARLGLSTHADEVHLPITPDGWRLALWRFRPETPRDAPPILLVHGLQANRFNLDLMPRRSLARWLRDRGYDVWVAELRGSGATRPLGSGVRHGGFDAHVLYDGPTLLGRVLAETRAEKVVWVGHSMGGMLGYVLASTEAGGHLAGLAAIGSPGYWDAIPGWLRGLLRLLASLGLGRIPLRPLLRAISPAVGWVHPPGTTLTYHPPNLHPAALRRITYNLVGDLHGDHLRGFARWIAGDVFDDAEGRDHREALARVTGPVFLMAGTADGLVPPSAVSRVRDALTGAEVTWVPAGRSEGMAEDYGHGDLLLGDRVEEEVFEPLLVWIEALD